MLPQPFWILASAQFRDSVWVVFPNRPFSYSEKECESNDISLQFVEFSNVHNCDRSSNAIQSKLAHKNV